jgi:hypothetical protein
MASEEEQHKGDLTPVTKIDADVLVDLLLVRLGRTPRVRRSPTFAKLSLNSSDIPWP